ncbi:MAG: hypothetical protein EHM55_18240 [Acidobacteria bacterium]|nr:MAG: hypothetical protein EHM55_18240 [Acidobacteriota bacterium]
MSRNLIASSIFALTVAGTPLWAQSQTSPPEQKPTPPLARWVEVQNVSVSVRYRFADNSAGTVTTNQVQHRETVRARVKFDAPGQYALNVGTSSGSRFTSGWNNTGIGIGDWQKAQSVRTLYLAARPIAGVEAQYGSMYIIRGESSEITTYDEDGYVIGERVSVRRPRDLFFDEMSATVGYFSSAPTEIGVSKRVKYLDERPNYGHFLVDKKVGTRGGVSVDFTSVGGARTWRAAANLSTRELLVADGILVETYKRTTMNPDYGFAVSITKALTRRVGVNWGYARIDPFYGGLNSDRFNTGKRVFITTTFAISSRLAASAFITTAVGDNVALPHRTLSNLIFSYNVLPDIRRSGLF